MGQAAEFLPMLFSLHDLELRKIEFAETYAPGHIDLGEETVQKSPLTVTGRAELLEEHHGGKRVVKDIRVVGKFATEVELRCARCVEAVALPLSGNFDLLYRPLSSVEREEEVSINEAESEIGYYKGEGLELEDVLKEQIFLAVPMQILCSEDCKGLCPQCGQNKNLGQCECKATPSDPRWAALADIKDKLKQ
jgi:uncharacterized protein